jgi:hypothetical protein
MTEDEYLANAKAFVLKLKDTPRVGNRPFGYPRLAWIASGACGTLGMLLGLPLILDKKDTNPFVILAFAGVVLFLISFTIRHVAYFWGWHTAVDRYTLAKLDEIERRLDQMQPR